MAIFVRVGMHWLNLEQVTSVELVESLQKPGVIEMVRVHYATGQTNEFTAVDQIRELAEFLKAHQAK